MCPEQVNVILTYSFDTVMLPPSALLTILGFHPIVLGWLDSENAVISVELESL
jgi:hypothetical protein